MDYSILFLYATTGAARSYAAVTINGDRAQDQRSYDACPDNIAVRPTIHMEVYDEIR